jgi:hypothetical protein
LDPFDDTEFEDGKRIRHEPGAALEKRQRFSDPICEIARCESWQRYTVIGQPMTKWSDEVCWVPDTASHGQIVAL